MGIAQEVRHQALRLADRQPRHPRTVPPEEEQAGANSARHERARRGLGKGTAMAGGVDDTVTVVAQVLARLSVGQTLRLRRSGPSGTVEVLARGDGALEAPAAVLGAVDGAVDAAEATGPHLIFGRHRVDELAGRLVAAIDDLELVTSSIVDAAGIERLLDGSGARTDVTVDGLLDRWDLPLVEQVQRYLSQRFTVAPDALVTRWANILHFSLGRIPHIVEVLYDPRRLRIAATIVHQVPASDELDLALHRLNVGDRLVRFRHHWTYVLAEVVLPAPTFMGQHVDAALEAIKHHEVFRAADAIVKEFGGEASFRKRYQPRVSDVLGPDDPTSDDPTSDDPTSDDITSDDTQEEQP